MKFRKLTAVFAAIGATVLMNGLAAAAAPVYVPDLSKACSVTVTVQTAGGERAPGGRIALYRVGTAAQGGPSNSGDYYFEYTADFSGFETAVLKDKTSADLSDARYAKALARHAASNGLPAAAAQAVGQDGKATVSGLTAGVYLIVQSEASGPYRPFEPFLVTLPYHDKANARYVYDVDAAPKLETVRKTERFQPVSIRVPVRKTVRGTGAPPDPVFSIRMKRLNRTDPMPGGVSADTVSLHVAAGETKEFDVMTYTEPGTYTYTVYEDTENPVRDFTYDTAVYWYTVKIGSDDAKLYVDQLTVREGSAEGRILYSGRDAAAAVIQFTNRYGQPPSPPSKPPKPRLPNTGQLWWPVWLLTGAGIVCVVAGIVRRQAGMRRQLNG